AWAVWIAQAYVLVLEALEEEAELYQRPISSSPVDDVSTNFRLARERKPHIPELDSSLPNSNANGFQTVVILPVRSTFHEDEQA
ncbi:MAG: hypothetical protein WCA16_08585, partial [Candidatus Sulfotelmatobacter sp.]